MNTLDVARSAKPLPSTENGKTLMARYYQGTRNPDYALAEMWQCPVIAVDVETVNLVNRAPVGVSVCHRADEAFYFTPPDIPLEQIRRAKHVIIHNCRFDAPLLGIDYSKCYDSEIACLVAGYPAKLATSVALLLNKELVTARDLMDRYKVKCMDQIPVEDVAAMCNSHAMACMELYWQVVGFPWFPWTSYELDMKMIPVIEAVEARGIHIHQPTTERLMAEQEEKIASALAACRQEARDDSFNPGSWEQVADMFYLRGHRLKLHCNNAGELKPQTDETTLKSYYKHDPLSKLILDYRHAQKARGTFIRPYLGKDKFHARYTHNVVDTGRLSSKKMEPWDLARYANAATGNSQNIPKSCRGQFVPTNGNVFEAHDFSQVELRVLAAMSKDPIMLGVYERNRDIHSETMERVGITNRTVAKTINFGIAYGATHASLLDTATKEGFELTKREAQIYIDGFMSKYTGVAKYIRETRAFAREMGYVETLFGRRRPIDYSKNVVHAANQAINTPIQGTAAEIFKMLAIDYHTKGAPIVAMVHDDVLMDLESGDTFRPSHQYVDFATPLSIKRGPNWGELEEV